MWFAVVSGDVVGLIALLQRENLASGFCFVLNVAWNWWRFSGDIVKDGIVLNEAQALMSSREVFRSLSFPSKNGHQV